MTSQANPIYSWLASLTGKVTMSVASAVALFLIGRFWKSVLRPWLESFFYRGARLASTYVGEFTFQGKQCNDLIHLKQWAYKVTGDMTFPAGGQGTYEFEGTFLNNVLRGTFNGTGTDPKTQGSFQLVMVPGQRELQGWFLDQHEGKIIALEYKWRPKSD